MKKLYVHLTMLVLLAALLVPMVGCKKDDTEMEESPAATTVETATTVEPSTMATDMGTTDTTMGTDMGMGTDMAPMGTEMSPPAGQ
jgi:uncharacterized lipoprotein YajG